MSFEYKDIPKIDNDVMFERLAKSLLKADTDLVNVNIHGRDGQKQDGVDVYARNNNTGEWIGVQCKVRSTNKSFTKKELLDEVNQAKIFNPRLNKYYLYTTLSRDVVTQGFEREINVELRENSELLFEIKYWEDIKDILQTDKEEYKKVYFRYYSSFFNTSNELLGHCVGKFVDLQLKFDNEPDSRCPLIIGKIPKFEYNPRLESFSNKYFLISLIEKKFKVFGIDDNNKQIFCLESDIADIVGGWNIDTYRIAKWIRSIEDMDDFIYSDEEICSISISTEERNNYHSGNIIEN